MRTILLKSSTCLWLVLGLACQVSSQSWIPVGERAFSDGEAFYQHIVVKNDVPYVAYTDRTNGDKATVMKYNGEEWVPVGTKGFSEGKVSSLRFAKSDETLYVAFRDDANDNKASVMKFVGSDWVDVGSAGFTESSADAISLAIDNNTPWIAFKDGQNQNKITVMKFAGEGWHPVGTPGFGVLTNVIHLAVENGTPYIAYRGGFQENWSACVMTLTDNNWVQLGETGFSYASYDSYHGLAVKDGIPYLAAWEDNAKATVYTYDGSGWKPLGTPGFSEGQALYQYIQISASGTPYVIFGDAGRFNKASLWKYNGSDWEQVGDDISRGNATFTSFDFDSNGIPYVAYRDNDYMRRTTVMKYGTSTGVSEASANKDVPFQVYPNPTRDVFTIELLQASQHQAVIEVLNLTGNVIYREHTIGIKSHTIELTNHPAGIYMVRVHQEDTTNSKYLVIQ